MTPFETTAEQRVGAAKIAARMADSGLPTEFIDAVLRLAFTDQGAYELMELWVEADGQDDRDEAVADLQELIDDAAEAPRGIVMKPKIHFNSLDGIAQQVLAHKKKLRDLIDAAGGVTEVARRSGIPQPSLSRMLNSASMPRRSTLYKIARAIDAEESAVVAEWVR